MVREALLVRQVLLLDADNLPLANPERLFETQEYKQNGALFFPDWWEASAWLKPAAYTLFGLEPPWKLDGSSSFKTSESGQILFNRSGVAQEPYHMIMHA
jgi:hypothetical protein